MKRLAILLSFFLPPLSSLLLSQTQTTKVSMVERPPEGVYKAPLHGGYLKKLPVGQVQPKGWLREVLLRQSKGLCGQLGTVSAWLEKTDNQWLSDHGDHGWEEVPYWLRGYASLAYILDDEAMKQEAQVWFDAVLNNTASPSEKDWWGPGFLGPKNSSGGRPEVWAQMIMLWALQTYYEHSGDGRVLQAMTNYFKWEMNLPDSLFLKDYWENKRGGDNEWSVVWLYNHTGDATLLPLIEKLHRNTCDWTINGDLPNWHGVNVAQGFREPATYYIYTGDHRMLRAAYDNHHEMRRRYGQVPGGMYGADENARPGYADPRQGAETCAVVEQMASDEMMMGITGDPSWADHLEDVAFNTLPVALTADMRALRYITSPNMAVSDGKNHAPSIDNNLRGMLSMSPFSSRCCQHNHGMGWPYLAEHLIMATADGGLATMVYLACETSTQVIDGNTIRLTMEGNYPFEEEVSITIHTETPVNFPLYMRLPSWADDPSLTLNGNPLTIPPFVGAGPVPGRSASYILLRHTWNDGDKLILRLPMTVNSAGSTDVPVRPISVRSRLWPGSISFYYGPLALSLKIDERYEQRDSSDPEIVQDDSHWQANVDKSLWPAYEIFAANDWNYTLELNGQNQPVDLSLSRRPWPADNYPFTPESVPLLFTTKGRKIPSWGFDQTGMTDILPPPSAPRSTTVEPIQLIPMGAARLRISAFPYDTTGSTDIPVHND